MPKAQTIEPVQSMTRQEYRAWVARQPVGCFERIDGVVVAMAPERVEHNDRKMLAWLALRGAILEAGASCHVQGDGMTVEVGDSDYEPDAVVSAASGWLCDRSRAADCRGGAVPQHQRH
jgi:Uma2 family endonuclease